MMPWLLGFFISSFHKDKISPCKSLNFFQTVQLNISFFSLL